ncbi:MAG TPA: rhamnulokinase family protein [Nocardioidaceae bacterium]|nr:rhamnulokinase family protein [Nocardioidaceae bacterium]
MTEWPTALAAVDLGATSGRVVLGRVDGGSVRLNTVSRFDTRPVPRNGYLRTDVHRLLTHALRGVADASQAGYSIASIAVDSWAADYGALHDGELLELPLHYRDESIVEGRRAVELQASPWILYKNAGLQPLPFNTIYQFATPGARRHLPQADWVLQLPDLFGFWLTGECLSERTIASTTGLLNAETHEWDVDLVKYTAASLNQLAPLVDPGTVTGVVNRRTASDYSLPAGIRVTAAGSHDTASAVAAIPAEGEDDLVFISSGTWSLVGCELEKPLLTRAAFEQGFSNELGVDGRIRFLHNVMGLWLLTETIREWGAENDPDAIDRILEAAAEVTEVVPIFNVNDPVFFAPGDMSGRIRDHCDRHGLTRPTNRATLVRSILESLSVAYAETIDRLRALTGYRPKRIHIVGGGSMNQFLCQLTADATGLVVVAGPIEATALGNVLIQARANGMVRGSLEQLRRIVANSSDVRTYFPTVAATASRRSPT